MVEGLNRFNSPDGKEPLEPLTVEEYDDMVERHGKQVNATVH